MASTTIVEISRLDFQKLSTPPLASITKVKHLSSYNWIEAPTPTIAVPGSPPLWSALRVPRRLQKDSGLVYIAQNAARHPDSPVEPLFRALYIANPSFDICSIDVVTDRNNIRKLLSFVNPDSNRNGLQTFTIRIEITENTAVFSREETATHEYIGVHEFQGFGHEFQKAYTTSHISGSIGHYRIISYRFGDLSFVVRHETDGYVDADTTTPTSNSKSPESDSLSSMLGSMSLSSSNRPLITTPAGSKLAIKEEGHVVPLESTLEIKTRVSYKRLEIQHLAPQLWISQTPKLVRAYHQKGVFQTPEVEDVATLIKRWEERNQTDLRKLAALVHEILGAVKRCGGNAMVTYDADEDKLVVSKFDGKAMLPKDLYSKWDGGNDSVAETNKDHDARAKRAVKPADGVETKAGAKSAVKPVDGVETKAGGTSIDTKGKKVTEAAEERQPTSHDGLSPNPTPAKDTVSGLRDEKSGNRAVAGQRPEWLGRE